MDSETATGARGSCRATALIGAVAVATGGYRIVLGESGRRRRQMPVFRIRSR
jgi:hypothetical protein